MQVCVLSVITIAKICNTSCLFLLISHKSLVEVLISQLFGTGEKNYLDLYSSNILWIDSRIFWSSVKFCVKSLKTIVWRKLSKIWSLHYIQLHVNCIHSPYTLLTIANKSQRSSWVIVKRRLSEGLQNLWIKKKLSGRNWGR